MATSYSSLYDDPPTQPHPYLREAKLYISGLAPNTKKEDLAELFRFCVPYRPTLPQDEQGRTLPGLIEFMEISSAEKALATLQNRPLPPGAPPCHIVLSPFPPTNPPTTLPAPQAHPRLIKQLPLGITDSQLYDLFRPFGPLANVRCEAGFGPDIAFVEFWNEEDARKAEEQMHCAQIGDQNISIQIYQPRRGPAGMHADFNAAASPFVPNGPMFQQQPQTPPHQQNVSQVSSHPSSFAPGPPPPQFQPHQHHSLFAIRPPVTPQPFSNILSLSSPVMGPNLYPHMSPPHSPPHPSLDLYGAPPANLPMPDMYGQQQQNGQGFHQPTPPMTPQRHAQHLGMYGMTNNHSPRSSPGQGSPAGYQTFSHLPFVNGSTPPHPPFYSPPNLTPPFNRSPPGGNSPFVHGPGQQVQFAPVYGPGSQSHSGLVDPCNLFIKNLDLEITSGDLFTHFRQFGHIVSARVMRSENGQSRGFGFVSFQTTDQASTALNAMNGVMLGGKPVIVRLHEPKQLRQEKLASRYAGRSPHPRSASGATSPSPSDLGDNQSPHDRARRSSGSYYHAALAGTLNMPMRYEELSSMSPVVRREILTGELTRRLRTMDTVAASDIEGLADSLVSLQLSDVIDGLQNPETLAEQVRKVKQPANEDTAAAQPNPSASSGEISSLSSTPAPPASAPDHPSTPLSATASLNEPPRTSSPSGSLLVGSEKDKLLASVARLDPVNAAEITGLLLSLSKKERALCLFNTEYLKNKVAEAKVVLEADDDGEATTASVSTVPASITPAKAGNGTLPHDILPSRTPELSSDGASAIATPDVPGTPNAQPTTVHTLASLARLPAAEIVKLANSPTSTGLPLPKADALVFKSTDEFIDGLAGQTEQQKKQVVGSKLFKVVKAFGVRNAKVTIHLLDTEDLRALTHLMDSYPSVLKEKVLQATAATAK